MPRKFLLGASLFGAMWGAQCAGALAAPGWTAPQNYALPSNASAFSVHIAYQTGGTATVAYLEIVSTSPLQTVLHVGVIPPGGSYQEQLNVPSTSSLVPADVGLAEAPDGAAAVQWASLQGSSSSSPFTYFASYRAAGAGSWDAPATLFTDSTTVSGISESLVPAISADGTAAAGIDHVDPTIPSPGGYRIDVAVHPPTGSWGSAVQISPTSQTSESLALGSDAHGNLTAAFRTKTTARYTLFADTRPESTGIWNSLQDVTGSDPTSDVFNPKLGVAPDGSAVIAFQYVHHAAPNTLDVNAVTRVGQSGPWSSVTDVAPGGASSAAVAAGVSPTDKAYVLYAFQGTSSGASCDGVVRASVGGTFSSPQCVSPTNFQNGSAGGLDFLGNDAYFGWSGQPGGGSQYVIQASRWLDGGAQPDVATNLESPGASFAFRQAIGDQDGSIALFWTSGSTLRAAAFDAGGPNLVSSSVPTSVVAGHAASLSATYADLWSGPATIGWSFGDGASATGAQVSHTYSQVGTYTVTVTASDGLGNQTTNTFSVHVTATATPPKLTSVGQSAKRWAENRIHHHGHGTPPPIGTTFRFTLDQPATVTLTFIKSATGRSVSGKCVRKTRKNRHKRHCRLTATAGRLALTGKPGANSFAFKGMLSGHRKLAPGSYKLTITATSTAHQSPAPATLSFTVVAP